MNLWQEFEMRTRLTYCAIFTIGLLAMPSVSLTQVFDAVAITFTGSLLYQYLSLLPALKRISPNLRSNVFANVHKVSTVGMALLLYIVLNLQMQPLTDETEGLFTTLLISLALVVSMLIATICCQRSFRRYT